MPIFSQRASAVALWVLLSLNNCSPDLSVSDEEVQIFCSEEAHCPQNFFCNLSTELCVPENRNQPPALSLDPIPRAASSTTLSLLLLDSESDAVSLDFSLALGDSATGSTMWIDLTPEVFSPDPSDLESSAPNNNHTLVWDFVQSADVGIAGNFIRSTDIFTSPFAPEIDDVSAIQEIKAVEFQRAAVLRVTPTDSFGNVGTPVDSEPFAIGNTPPSITLTGWEEGQSFERYLPIEFELADSAADPALIRLQYCLGCTDPEDFLEATVAFGGASGALTTTVEGEKRVVVWDSQADLGAGAGLVSNAIVRIRAVDTIDGSSSFLSPWSVRSAPPINNP